MRVSFAARLVATAVVPAFSLCCSADAGTAADGDTAEIEGPIVYGDDDRKDYFEIEESPVRSRLRNSIVALVPRAFVDRNAALSTDVPSSGERFGLCPGEPFAEQPAAAFCSGVLVDWNLVLTAGHCVRVLPLEELAVVFGYYYRGPGRLAIGSEDVVEPVEIVAEALDTQGQQPRLDYALIRLEGVPRWPREPVPVRLGPLQLGQKIIAMGSGGGVPLKVDSGGEIRDLRDPWFDFFVADTDTSAGSSGGAAFDQELNLLGVVARGGADFVESSAGCRVTSLQPNGVSAQEHYTHATRALEGLCESNARASSLCRPDCQDPCRALSLPRSDSAQGCTSVSARRQPEGSPFVSIALAATALWLVRRRSNSLECQSPSSRLRW